MTESDEHGAMSERWECGNCGQPMSGAAHFCSNCGTGRESRPLVTPAADQPSTGVPETPPSDPNRHRHRDTAILLILGMWMLGFITIILLVSGSVGSALLTGLGAAVCYWGFRRMRTRAGATAAPTSRRRLKVALMQFSEEIQKCGRLGMAGEIAEFSRCMDDAYSGFREDTELAYTVADNLLADTAKQCRESLKSYKGSVVQLTDALERVHKAGSMLDFDARDRCSAGGE
jgi:hypothetical protein